MENILYRAFYAQGNKADVEVVINESGYLEIGALLGDKYRRLSGEAIMDDTTFYFSRILPSPSLFGLEESNLLAQIHTGAEMLAQHTHNPSVAQMLKAGAQIAARNIIKLIMPYEEVSRFFSSPAKKILQMFPEYQTHALFEYETKDERAGRGRMYLLKSPQGMPYTLLTYDDEPVYFRTSFGASSAPLPEYVNDYDFYRLFVLPPYLLDAKHLYSYVRDDEHSVRVYYAKFDDFNPCLVQEHIVRKTSPFSGIKITPFPAKVYRQYLRGERINLRQWEV